MSFRSQTIFALVFSIFCHCAMAQEYPTKPIKVIVPYPPGGANDLVVRPYSIKLQEALGQPVVVDYMPGGDTVIGLNALAKSPPDGYTMGMVSFSFPLGRLLPQKTPFDPLRDFSHLSLLGKSGNILVSSPALPVRNLKEFITLAKSKPGELNYGIVGAAASGNLAMLALQSMAGIKLTPVPYKGAAQTVPAVASGEIHSTFTIVGPAVPLVKANKVIALGVTGAKRTAAVPDVPTISEAGVPGYEESGFYGVVLPAKVPAAIMARLYRETVRVVGTDEVKKVYAGIGIEPETTPPEEFTKLLTVQYNKWAEIFKKFPLPEEK